MPHCRIVLLAAFLLIAPAIAQAAASLWPASPIPGYLQISNPMGSSFYRQDAVISDGSGGGFVGWPEFGTIRVQHKLASGLIASGWVPVGSTACPSTPGGNRDYVSLAPDAGQGVYAAWVDSRPGDFADIYLQHLLGDGTVAPGWPSDGVRVTNVASTYDFYPVLGSDGAGGVYVCWVAYDLGTGTPSHRVTRLTSAGAFASGWSFAGVALHTTGTTGWPAVLASDGANGVLAAFVADSQLRVQRLLANGTQDTAHWPADGAIVSNNVVASTLFGPVMVARAPAETYLAWCDRRFGQSDAYVLRLTPDGISAGWPATGVAAASTVADENDLAATLDGTGGVLLAWIDTGTNNVVARRVLANGALDPAWPAAGRTLIQMSGIGGERVGVAPAASDGMLVIGSHYNTGSGYYELVASRVRANGFIPAEWAAGPTLMSQTTGYIPVVRAVADGNDGAIAFSMFQLFGSLAEVGQRVRWDGTLGLVPRPRLTAVRDVGPDQGGRVRVFCNASEGDTLPSSAVANYALWRQVTASVAQGLIARGAKVAGPEAAGGAVPGSLREARAENGTQLYWEYVGSWPSRAVPAYSQMVTTASDSLPGSIPWETFVIDAVGGGGAILATSPADSGYSVDNLSPPAPAPFLAAYAAGATHLHWGPSAESDFHHFALHRSADGGFVPGPATQIASSSDTGYADPGPAGSYYRLAAVDVHGNVGAYSLVTPATTTDVAGESVFKFALGSPNPAGGEALLRYTLPYAGEVELALFDVAGRRARVIARGARAPGNFAERWDGTDENGRRVPDGVYLARLTHAGHTLVRRFSLIR